MSDRDETRHEPAEDPPGDPEESLGRRAAKGAAWSIISSVGGRAIGLVSTLVLTRYLDPEVYGAVSVAAVIVLLSELTEFGLLQYVVAKPKEGPEAAFHASSFHIMLGALSLTAIYLLREPLSLAFNAPGAAVFVLGLCIADMLNKTSMAPEQILAKSLRFGAIEGSRAVSEMAYAGSAVGLAVLGFGGFAIVYANIGQWAIFLVALVGFAGLRRWARPYPLRWQMARKIWGFGLPISIGSVADMAACDWDNLLIARFFGEATVGRYSLAKNLAEIPAVHVGEQIGQVLLPSFAQMDDEQRREALLPAHALLALVVTPLAMGLGLVAPTVTSVVFDESWQGIEWMLAILSGLSIFRPVGRVAHAYLLAIDRPKTAMSLDICKAILMLGCVAALSTLGVLWACAGVGVAFLLHALGNMVVLWRVDQVSLSALLIGTVQPILAGLPMIAAVLGVRAGLRSVGLADGIIALGVEITAGGLAYILAGLIFAPTTSRRFIRLVKVVLLGIDEDEDEDEDDGDGDADEDEHHGSNRT